MIIFLYGADSFRSGQKLKEIVTGYKAKNVSGLNFWQAEWSADLFVGLKETLSSFSMFSEKKLFVIQNACRASETEQEKLVALLEEKEANKDEEIILVFFENDELKAGILFKWLVKKAKMTEKFEALSGIKLKNWVQKKVADAGGKITNSAADMLLAFVGVDLWQMAQEIDKLVSYKADKLITEEDVGSLVKSKFDPNIFATIDALANRNKSLAYKLMHQHLSQGENEIYILTMFVYQFRNLLQIKSLIDGGISSDALAKKTGLHPFVIKKSWALLKNFSLEVLKKIYERLLALDIAIKRGRIEPQVALDLIVGEIAN